MPSAASKERRQATRAAKFRDVHVSILGGTMGEDLEERAHGMSSKSGEPRTQTTESSTRPRTQTAEGSTQTSRGELSTKTEGERCSISPQQSRQPDTIKHAKRRSDRRKQAPAHEAHATKMGKSGNGADVLQGNKAQPDCAYTHLFTLPAEDEDYTDYNDFPH